jgi:anaerobic magnesium-protoporphyrin IX monomethyl ester cyclase
MDSVDIVLVKPGSQKQLYGELSSFKLTAIEPPTWAALLAAFLRKQGYSVLLLDAEIENWSYRQTAERIAAANPLAVAIMVSGTNPSASTMNMTGAGAILRDLEELAPQVKTLLAGLHPSALPERTMREETVDFVCQGEGIYTFPALLDALKAGHDTFSIPGLWFRKDGAIISNPRPPLVQNLDELPMPAWDLLPMERYRAHNWHCFDEIDHRQPYGVIYTSLGCPFRCSFCCINALFGKPGIRYRSPHVVIEEIDYLVRNYGIKNIKFLDEMFAMKESHVGALCDLIIERGYDLNIWAYARVNTVNSKMLRKMKQAGINWLAYGFESANKKVLKDVSKGFPVEMVDSVVQMTKDNGIYICGNFMFGLPEDDLESMSLTLEKTMEINSEWVNFQATMAYPGSKLYDLALAEDWPLPETWQGFSQYSHDTLPLPTKYLSGPEVLAFRDEAFVKYFTNPHYLDSVTAKFGPKIEQHIREMVSHKIPRKYCD